MDDPRVLESMAKVREAAKKAGKTVMGWGTPGALYEQRKAEGYEMLAIGMDTMLLNKALAAELASVGGQTRW